MTVFRQNSLTLDAVFDYDPFGASYAFSPIGFQGITCGGGNTENCRHSTSLKYRVSVGQFRAAALWQFGGYAENNASNGAYQLQVGAEFPMGGNGVLAVDAIYSSVRDSVSVALRQEATTRAGCRYPRSCHRRSRRRSPTTAPQCLWRNRALKLFAGYGYIRYAAPSDPQAAFTDIAGSFLCLGCGGLNNTNINNTAFGVNGFGNKIFQVMWTGAKYAVTDQLDVIAGYYHYIQDSYFGTPGGGLAPCFDSSHAQCAGTFDAISAAVDWRFAPKWDLYFGLMFSQVNGGLASGFFQHNNIDPTVGLSFRF